MELVSANTKNYLFLTMNQFNEKNGLVRARVTMRRDQPFWEGGNSFIACESFRISAAPSQGGLYYKLLPDTFYLGAVDRKSSPDDDDVDWNEVTTPNGDNYVALLGKELSPANNPQQRDVTIMTCLCDHLQNELLQSDPSYILTKFGELWNDHGLESGQPARLTTGNNAGNLIHYPAKITKSPVDCLSGPGGGPDGLFLPVTGDWASLADGTEGYLLIGHQTALHLDLGIPASQGTDFKKQICQMLGENAYFEITKGPDGNISTVPVAIQNAGMQYMGPSSIEVDGINDLWLDPPADLPDGTKGQRQLKRKIYWDTDDLKVGSTVRVYVPTNGAVVAHYKHGTVTTLADDWMTEQTVPNNVGLWMGCTIHGGMFKLTDSMSLWLNDPAHSWGTDSHDNPATGADAWGNMVDSDFPWVMTSTTNHWPGDLNVNLEVELDLAPTDGAATQDQLNAMNQAMPVTHFARRKGIDRELNRIERRACDRGDSRYVYTPNELYWLFNNPQNGFDEAGEALENTPYLLQTHENGGFKVVWDGTFTDFYISVAMHDALGLCGYFEYQTKKAQTDSTTWDIAIQKPLLAMRTWDHTYSSAIHHVPASSVYAYPLAQPPVLIDPSAVAIGTPVCLIDGTQYVLVSKEIIKDKEQKWETIRVYPTTIVDSDGVPQYSWRNLPAAVLGNTQQVSIESFGTYSGINIVIPNLPFQPMLGTQSDDRILASLRLPFEYGTDNKTSGIVGETDFSYYGDLLFNSDSSRSYLRITTDQQLYDCDVEARLIRRDGAMEVLYLPYQGQFEIKLRFLQTQ